MSPSSWWLRGEGEDSLAKRITPAGVVLGRSPHCDVILRSELASRRHALVYLGVDGPRLVPLGRAASSVNGVDVDQERGLEGGDRLTLPGQSLTVARQEGDPVSSRAGAPVWVLEGPGGGLFGMAHSPFLVGGSLDDDLYVAGWPDGALCFKATGGGLEVEAAAAIRIGDDDVPSGEARWVRRGQQVSLGGSSVTVVTGGELASGSTASIERSSGGVTRIHLEFLPRGGRLHLTVGGEVSAVYLTDRRCDLVAVLLQPPEPLGPGDYVEDGYILSRVWGKKAVDRTHLNVLLHRVRKDLHRIGLDGAALIQRSEGGGATRFVLVEGAQVVLE